MPTRPTLTLRLLTPLLLAVPLAGAPGGCAAPPVNLDRAGPAFPDGFPQATQLDVQAFLADNRLTLTNTTARHIPPGRLWLNRWYSREFPGLAVAESIELPLAEFTDRFGAEFRGGGFFATEKPDTLVQAQVESGGELIGLVVVAAPED
ncbi:MAG TPA: hypothetical protein VD963_05805 [Phycisphaerales bacterium]|nr:hypothetical protein [Phycisphaerales bacterium]